MEEFTELATELVDEVPPLLCKNLNGGFIVMPEAKTEGDSYIMAEYIEEETLGMFIAFYYGSFAAVLGSARLDVWKEEIRLTIWHELRHHLESLAGTEDLAKEERELLEKYYKNKG